MLDKTLDETAARLTPGEAKLLVLRYVKRASLRPDPRNARKHSREQVASIANSIGAFGFNNPILHDADGVIVAGEGRWLAAGVRGLDEVPAINLGHLTEQQRRAYALADNRIALDATWDEAKLARELAALEAGMAKLAGFSDKEVERLLASALEVAGGGVAGVSSGLTDPEAIPAAPARPVSAIGDIWCCGKHRVICGDATNGEHVAALLAGGKPHLMATDPPYGVEYDPAWRADEQFVANRRRDGKSTIKTGAFAALGAVQNDDRADWREAWALFPGDVAYVWHSALFAPEVALSLEAVGFERRAQIIWRKPHFAISRGHYHWQHEPCWYVVRQGATGHWAGDRKQTTIWDITSLVGFTTQTEGENARTGHSTQKPVECMRRPILNNSMVDDAVYDPFLGSGTTLIAAEMTARVCYGCELSPAYVDIIVKRWQDFTGRQAVLDGDGRSFEATGVERGALLAI
jgi:DNA modification methylase